MTSIDVLISTLNDGVYNLSRLQDFPNVRYIICHQVTNQKAYRDVFFGAESVSYSKVFEAGLSLSRNFCLDSSSADIKLISDDDVTYCERDFSKIRRTFQSYPDADIICFKSWCGSKSRALRDDYPDCPVWLKDFREHVPFSIEIAIRGKCKSVPRFDADFGVGARFPLGEERIFIAECLRSDLSILFVPEFIVSHWDDQTTGQRKFDDPRLIVATGAYYFRLYGPIIGLAGIFRNVMFNRRRFLGGGKAMLALKMMVIGAFAYSRGKW